MDKTGTARGHGRRRRDVPDGARGSDAAKIEATAWPLLLCYLLAWLLGLAVAFFFYPVMPDWIPDWALLWLYGVPLLLVPLGLVVGARRLGRRHRPRLRPVDAVTAAVGAPGVLVVTVLANTLLLGTLAPLFFYWFTVVRGRQSVTEQSQPSVGANA